MPWSNIDSVIKVKAKTNKKTSTVAEYRYLVKQHGSLTFQTLETRQTSRIIVHKYVSDTVYVFSPSLVRLFINLYCSPF